MTKALKHTDGRIIVINNFAIKGASKTDEDFAHEREGEVQATMYKDGAQALRDQAGTLDEFEKVIRKYYSVPEVLDAMTMTTTLPMGEALWELVYDFILTKAGEGWSKI